MKRARIVEFEAGYALVDEATGLVIEVAADPSKLSRSAFASGYDECRHEYDLIAWEEKKYR